MFGLFIIAVVAIFVLPIGISVSALRKANKANREVSILKSIIEGKVDLKESGYVDASMQTEQKTQEEPNTEQVSSSESIDDNQIQTPASTDTQLQEDGTDFLEVFFNWFKENWVMKLGVLFVLVGFVSFVSYAFVVGWIGPYGKIATGFVIGVIVTIFANSRMKKSISQGSSLIILGIAILLFTVYYASYVYEFFNEFISLTAVLVVAAYVNVVALQYNLKSLSVVGLLVSASAPLFANSSSADYIFLFSYLAVITAAHLWIMYYKEWRFLGSVASLVVLFYSMIYFVDASLTSFSADSFVVFFIAMALSIMFLVTNVLNISKFKEDPKASDGSLAVLNGILVCSWVFFDPYINSLASSVDIKTLLLSAWMIMFAFGSYYVFIKNKNISYFYIYSAVSIVFLAIITALQLDGAVLTFAYIFESAVISIIGYAVTSKLQVGYRLSLLMIIPAFISLGSFFSSSWATSVFNEDFAIILSMALVLLGVGYFYTVVSEEEDKDYVSGVELRPHTIMIIAGTLFLYGLIWTALTSFYDGAQIAILISLTIYTIIGLACYIFGKIESRIVFKSYGAFLLVLVIARLLLVDIWNMDAIMKVATFSIIGIMFIATSFIKSEKRELPDNDVNV
ncbi:DUF2339 domain-containing protein [Candidatus Parcubacteria bacterium]|nr:DUF2339 domain-containing protein [Candidatus Parcubacteria bacterium]